MKCYAVTLGWDDGTTESWTAEATDPLSAASNVACIASKKRFAWQLVSIQVDLAPPLIRGDSS